MEAIDRKYKIQAVNPVTGKTYSEENALLFSAKDAAVPAALLAYAEECKRIGAKPEHIESVFLLHDRVLKFQSESGNKVPDTIGQEIPRCLQGVAEDPSRTKSGVELIAEERQRQLHEEHRTTENDDLLVNGELALAGACYAEFSAAIDRDEQHRTQESYWPWHETWWKPTTPLRDLVKAGALIAAEIDRLQRAEPDH